MKINSWKDIWKGPFWTDNYGWVYDADNTPVFTADDLNEDNDEFINTLTDDMVEVLNGKEPSQKYHGFEIRDGCDIYLDDVCIGYFRGWGHMCGSLKLSSEKAAKYQDEMIEFVLSKISKE